MHARSARPFVAAIALCAGVAAQAPWTQEQLASDLDEIAAAIRSQWSYLDDHRQHFGVDLAALVAAARQECAEVTDAAGWALVLRRLASGLQDGHAIVRVPGVGAEPARRLPLRFEPCAEGLVVTSVTAGVDAAVGDLLLQLDGIAVADALASLEREQSGSTPGMRRRLAIDRLHRSAADAVTLTLAGADDTREVRVETVAATAPVPRSRPRTDNWSLSWQDGGTALLRISSFTVPRWQEWLRAAPEEREPFLTEARQRIGAIVDELLAKSAKALIIDLRGNNGGTDSLGIHLAERLLEEPFRYFLLSSRRDGVWSDPHGFVYGEGDHPRFTGRLVLLTDELSFSTTDNFARCLTDLHPDVTVIGRPTGAGTGAPRVFVTTTHTRAEFGACTMRVYGPNGELTEGRGTEPDVPITWTREDRSTGRDPDLAAALLHLQEAPRRVAPGKR